ncbi:MAG: signal recognition particle protein Srp19 [Thermoplasmata archaeon HGW-Thermoplasmata-1]|nr:MAG: signal recognition particle protein Srp19 [Thermoplasmata archaeon HGW-Thermoplasmata-1]
MVSKREKKLVLWPHYFDASLTRRQGRRVPKASAVHEPGLERISHAATVLQLRCVIEEGAAHPFLPWKKTGRVLIESGKISKEELIRQVARRL